MNTRNYASWKIVLLIGELLCVTRAGAISLESLLSPRSTMRTVRATDPHPSTEPQTPESLTTVKTEYGEYPWPIVWTSWSEWSTCSSTTMVGFRVRNRVCPKEDECSGDDIQLLKCNSKSSFVDEARFKYSKKYVEQCKRRKNSPDKSLSCKLYLENPDLAYDIFRQNSCFFTVSNEEDLFPLENETVPIPRSENEDENGTGEPPDQNSVIEELTTLSLDSNRETSVSSKNLVQLKTVKKDGNHRERDDENQNSSAYMLSVLNALIAERKCRAQCDNTLTQAARLWALGTSSARSLSSTIGIMERNEGRLTEGVGAMFFEYNVCIKKCYALSTTSSFLSAISKRNRSKNSSPGEQGIGTNLVELLRSLEPSPRVVKQGRKKREAPAANSPQVESLCRGTPPACSETPPKAASHGQEKRRRKRQISQEYESPCFSSEDQVPSRDIERKARAELFFFESYVQKFTCRKCDGTKHGRTGLYLPKEPVWQERGSRSAFCRQGFLKRHGLFIVEDPNGKFTFATGERFNIESRTFEVESHCEIVIRK